MKLNNLKREPIIDTTAYAEVATGSVATEQPLSGLIGPVKANVVMNVCQQGTELETSAQWIQDVMSTAAGEQSYDIVIIGAGPGGISAAVRAAQRGMSHILLEASDQAANTIRQYQEGKHVMAEPDCLPLRSDIAFDSGSRETFLNSLEGSVERARVNIRYDSLVTGVEGSKGRFEVTLRQGGPVFAKAVLLAIGVQGTPRRLGVPGEDLDFVQNTMDESSAYQNETIVIIGAGDSAIEDALALMGSNRVILVNRRLEFSRAKEANVSRIQRAIANQQVLYFSEAQVTGFAANPAESRKPGQVIVKTAASEVPIDCDQVITRLGAVPNTHFLKSLGVRLCSGEGLALPELSGCYETSVPGLYIIGSLAGFPLIKEALNQGYEVIEHLQGNPVEPADHMLLANKIKALPFAADVEGGLAEIQKRAPLFSEISPMHLREVVLRSAILNLKAGATVVAYGDYSAAIYCILQGAVQLNWEDHLKTLVAGEFFGEISFLSGRPNPAGITVSEDCVILEMPRNTIKKLIRTDSSVRRKIERCAIERAIKLFVAPRTPIEIIRSVSGRCQLQVLADGETLFRQDDVAEGMYVLLRGSVTLSRKRNERDVLIAHSGAGSTVGLMALLGVPHRMATARASGPVEVLHLDGDSFTRLLAENPSLRDDFRAQAKKRLAQYTQMQAVPEKGDILEFLMTHGVGEATDVLIIDETLCVGCNNCESACAATHHGVSRLNRAMGPSYASLHIPLSCRHCEHPHCMEDCPPHAITRLPQGEVYISEACIGCGNCEANCPYDAIQMAALPPKQNLLKKWLGKTPAPAVKTAVKCDLCTDRKGLPACVSACPTGAAIRVDAKHALALADSKSAQ